MIISDTTIFSHCKTIKKRFRWRIILKGNLNSKVIDVINEAIQNIDSKTTRIIVDTNPNNLN